MAVAIKIIIADDVQEMRDMIEKMLMTSDLDYEIVGFCANGAEVVDLMQKKKADIILMDINMPVMNGLEATQTICEKYPQVRVIIMSVQQESEYLKKAMLAGAKAYIMKPVDIDELVDTIKTTYERYQFLDTAAPVKAPQTHHAQVISFFSAKGGVGKSMIALNSALLMHDKLGKKVMLVDLDLQFGDIALMVNKQNELTIKEMFDDSPIKTMEDVQPYIHSYKSGVDMLFAPKDPESAEYISKDQVNEVIELLKKHYDIIIIDTGVNYDEVTLNALDHSDRVIIVTNLEVTGLKNTKLSLRVMQSLNYDHQKVKILVNMTNDKFGVTKANVQKAFNYDVIGYLPEDIKLVRNATNTGIPLAQVKNASLIKPLLTICQTLIK
ncbi:MAG: response regulator [Firmicutes bacterium]|nr:response regulator [Bacillota bacterium]